MSELILTEKEKEDLSILDWDDKAIADLVRHSACTIKERWGDDENNIAYFLGAAYIFLNTAISANATEFTQTVTGLTYKGEDQGDWKILIEKINQPA